MLILGEQWTMGRSLDNVIKTFFLNTKLTNNINNSTEPVCFLVHERLKPKYPEKTTDLSQVPDKLYRVHLVTSGIRFPGIPPTTKLTVAI